MSEMRDPACHVVWGTDPHEPPSDPHGTPEIPTGRRGIKPGTLRQGSRDGALAVVARDRSAAVRAGGIETPAPVGHSILGAIEHVVVRSEGP